MPVAGLGNRGPAFVPSVGRRGLLARCTMEGVGRAALHATQRGGIPAVKGRVLHVLRSCHGGTPPTAACAVTRGGAVPHRHWRYVCRRCSWTRHCSSESSTSGGTSHAQHVQNLAFKPCFNIQVPALVPDIESHMQVSSGTFPPRGGERPPRGFHPKCCDREPLTCAPTSSRTGRPAVVLEWARGPPQVTSGHAVDTWLRA